MFIVEAIADTVVKDAGGNDAYPLRRGERYLLHDHEAGLGWRGGALVPREPVEHILPRYRGDTSTAKRLLIPFIGRLGDALALASCAAALRESAPGVAVDVACLKPVRDVLALFPGIVRTIEYPIRAAQLADYDHYASFEHIEAIPDAHARSLADVFSECLHTPRPVAPARPVIPEDVVAKWSGTAGLDLDGKGAGRTRPRVAIHPGLPGCPRSYPLDLAKRLALLLADGGMTVYWIGATSQRANRPTVQVDHSFDLINRTPTTSDLGAVLKCVDAVVTCDSFPMHLAGALGATTIAIFTSTNAVLASDYPSITALQADVACSPCGVAEGACPLGHARCIAHRTDALGSDRIAKRVRAAIANARGLEPVPSLDDRMTNGLVDSSRGRHACSSS